MAGEHYNLGPGWMCQEIDGRLSNPNCGSHELSDVQDTEPVNLPPFLEAMNRGDGRHTDFVQKLSGQ